MLSGAAPLGIDLVKAVKTRLESLRKDSGKKIAIVQGYGLTETSPTTHILPAADHIRKGGSIGRLLPNLEARLMLDGKGGDSNDAEEGQPGELWVRGPSIMKGYRNNAVATEDSITRDGWFKTGDIAIRDAEGYFAIVDRRKELIKYKVGFRFTPASHA
jgi:long-subunit acyl-CoA synthetase (AMP-forming)